MRILIDMDVLLDFAIGREPFFADNKKVLAWARNNPGDASVAWHSLSNLAYLAPVGARSFLQDLLRYIKIPTVGTTDAVQALHLPMADIEDAMQAAAALAFHARWIVTRNERDYRSSPVPALSPAKFIKQITAP